MAAWPFGEDEEDDREEDFTWFPRLFRPQDDSDDYAWPYGAPFRQREDEDGKLEEVGERRQYPQVTVVLTRILPGLVIALAVLVLSACALNAAVTALDARAAALQRWFEDAARVRSRRRGFSRAASSSTGFASGCARCTASSS